MKAEKNLKTLLNSISPKLNKGEFVFCTFENGAYGDHAGAEPVASYMEREGLTLVLKKKIADRQGFIYEGVFKCITLEVYSSLNAVGLTAAISTVLSEHNISANVIAAFYHDHVFVPSKEGSRALKILMEFCCKPAGAK